MATTEMEADRRNETTLAFGENYLGGAAGLSLILLPAEIMQKVPCHLKKTNSNGHWPADVCTMLKSTSDHAPPARDATCRYSRTRA